jgi:histidyl-tRNA synthetase
VSQAQEEKKDKGKFDLNPPRGTRDFFPEDHRLKSWLFGKFRLIADRFGFEEYDAPVVESEELYIRKAGEEVTQQLYNFEDKGGRRLSLRPEMTPSLARMVLSKKNALPLPLKWFAIPQCWRYERTTRGRRREHYQWNMDIWGVEGVEAEAELLAATVASMEEMGLTAGDVGIKINSRKILTGLMTKYGIPEHNWAATCVLIDKLEKVPVDAIMDDLTSLGLTKEVVEELLTSLQLGSLDAFAAELGDDNEGVRDLQRVFELARGYGIEEWLVFDASVVRGLAYYTGVVFEGFDRTGELRAIFGGGRYDKLLESMGGEATPAVGFGFGDAVIVELLKTKGLLPDTASLRGTQVLLYCRDAPAMSHTLAAASALRRAGVSVDLVLGEKKPKWVFSRADKAGMEAVVIYSASDSNSGSGGGDDVLVVRAGVKSMATGEQTDCDGTDAAGLLEAVFAVVGKEEKKE